MGGHILDQPLPNAHMEQLDPFLLIHHAVWHYPGAQRSRDLGIGGHPHRGFSPVTFVLQGDVRHQDSLGHDQVVEAGGTQWMNAGRGVTHSERPSARLAKDGGTQEIIQFWVNTPAKHKMDAAYYHAISKEETPVIEGHNHSIHIVAGTYKGQTGPAKTLSPMTLLRVHAEPDAEIRLTIPHDYNTLLYALDGELSINNQTASAKDLIWFNNNSDSVQVTAKRQTRFTLLAGEPIGEEIISYGPFVMNTQTQILEAIRDAQMGKMGILIENFDD